MRLRAVDWTIFMPLLNEGTDVWRPVKALKLGETRYRVTDEASEDEEWLFVSGTIVVVDADRRVIAAELNGS